MWPKIKVLAQKGSYERNCPPAFLNYWQRNYVKTSKNLEEVRKTVSKFVEILINSQATAEYWPILGVRVLGRHSYTIGPRPIKPYMG